MDVLPSLRTALAALTFNRVLYPSDFKKPGRQASGEDDERILNT